MLLHFTFVNLGPYRAICIVIYFIVIDLITAAHGNRQNAAGLAGRTSNRILIRNLPREISFLATRYEIRLFACLETELVAALLFLVGNV